MPQDSRSGSELEHSRRRTRFLMPLLELQLKQVKIKTKPVEMLQNSLWAMVMVKVMVTAVAVVAVVIGVTVVPIKQ